MCDCLEGCTIALVRMITHSQLGWEKENAPLVSTHVNSFSFALVPL